MISRDDFDIREIASKNLRGRTSRGKLPPVQGVGSDPTHTLAHQGGRGLAGRAQMGCGSSVARDPPSAAAGQDNDEREAALAALRRRGEAVRDDAFDAFDRVASLLDADDATVLYMLERELLVELLSILQDKAQQHFHEPAGQLLEALQRWALRTVEQRPRTRTFEPAARSLMALVEHKPVKKDRKAKPGLKRTNSSDGLKRTSSFESNEHGLYPEMVIALKKPYRVLQVNEPWEQVFGHRKETSLGRTINLILGPDTNNEKLIGLLETTARDGTACGLLAFHDSSGDSMMVTLTVTGIFGVGEGDDEDGYTSCMLIFR